MVFDKDAWPLIFCRDSSILNAQCGVAGTRKADGDQKLPRSRRCAECTSQLAQNIIFR